MADLWPFENVGCTYVTLVTLVTTESSSKSKSIWPILYTYYTWYEQQNPVAKFNSLLQEKEKKNQMKMHISPKVDQ